MAATTTRKPQAQRPTWDDLRPEVTDELLADITHRIVEKFHPHKVILFGSYVWGKPHVYSDVDLLVVMDSKASMVQRMIDVADEAEVRFLPMHILVYTPAELRERLSLGDDFFSEILTKGKVLFERALADVEITGDSAVTVSAYSRRATAEQRAYSEVGPNVPDGLPFNYA